MRHNIIAYVASASLLLSMAACNDDDVTINTTPIVSSVTTGDASVTATTATISGSVSDISSQSAGRVSVGVVYSTTETPTVSGSRQIGTLTDGGNFTTDITGLTDGVTYYYAAFVTLQDQVTYYGDVKQFVTTSTGVATAKAGAVTSVSATLGGTLAGVDDKLAAESLPHGIIISTSESDLAKGLEIASASTTNSFTVDVNTLVPNTTYYYAVYSDLDGRRSLGNVEQFTTSVSGADALAQDGDFVDMGTSREWAKYNVGAAAEAELGGLYGHGDISGLARSESASDYPETTVNSTASDIALAAGMGMMPTADDWNDLIKASTIEAAEVDGVKGVKFTSNSTGNTLFFPAAGIRNGATVTDAELLGCYATGRLNDLNPEYVDVIKLTESGATTSTALRTAGLSVRPVRKPFVRTLPVDVAKLVVNNKDGNGTDLRIEIYNEYGSTKENSPIDPSQLKFDRDMVINFSIAGINDNLVEGARGSYRAGISYAADGWWPSYWTGGGSRYDALVAGDGNYTVWARMEASASGAVVFCVEIFDLWKDLIDTDKVTISDFTISLDPEKLPVSDVAVDNSMVIFNNKDGNGVDGRIEIYNEWGDSKNLGADFSWMQLGAGTMTVEFNISGIDGNLQEDAPADFPAAISYVAKDWAYQYWGGSAGDGAIQRDGSYTLQCPISYGCEGATVWTIELYNLWVNLVDPSKVKVEITNVTIPN